MHHWKAEVTVSGVPVVTDEEYERVQSVISGVTRHETGVDDLNLTWRFTNGSPEMADAITQASATWQEVIEYVESAIDPACTDFRVRRVMEV